MSGLAHRQEPFVFMAAFLDVLADRSGRPDLNHEELAALAIVIGVDKPVVIPTITTPITKLVVEDRVSMAAFLKDDWQGEGVDDDVEPGESARMKRLNDDLFLERKARSALQRWKDSKRDGGKRLWPALTAILELHRTE